MRKALLVLAALAAAPLLSAGLTADQKELELRTLAAQYAKHYAPYEWKRELFGFDLYNLAPWIARARATATDLDYYQVCGEYVASLQDSHSSYGIYSSFRASLPVHADYYENVPRIDFINRTALPAADFPFQIGDELVSVDGVPIAEVVERNGKTVYSANNSARRRTALQRLFSTAESSNARAALMGDELAFVIRSRTTGEETTHLIPVTKFGQSLAEGGVTPSPAFESASAAPLAAAARPGAPAPRAAHAAQSSAERVTTELLAPWLAPLAPLASDVAHAEPWGDAHEEAFDVLGFGARPGFVLPPGFTVRLGRFSGDPYFSGTYTAGGKRIGFIRIATFSPSISATAALAAFETEMTFFNANTDGLIVDVMRNSGGSACYNEEIQRRVIPYAFRGIGREIRASRGWVQSFHTAWQSAMAAGLPPHVIALAEANYRDIARANSELRGRTGPLPICAETLDRLPHATAYRKPLIVLADEYSASAADAFPAVLQDAARGPIFGFRTNGAGGTIGSWETGPYSEASSSATIAMHHRRAPVNNPGYPSTHYVENAGVYPDLPYDYMSLDNLLQAGIPFRDAVTEAILQEIERKQ